MDSEARFSGLVLAIPSIYYLISLDFSLLIYRIDITVILSTF